MSSFLLAALSAIAEGKCLLFLSLIHFSFLFISFLHLLFFFMFGYSSTFFSFSFFFNFLFHFVHRSSSVLTFHRYIPSLPFFWTRIPLFQLTWLDVEPVHWTTPQMITTCSPFELGMPPHETVLICYRFFPGRFFSQPFLCSPLLLFRFSLCTLLHSVFTIDVPTCSLLKSSWIFCHCTGTGLPLPYTLSTVLVLPRSLRFSLIIIVAEDKEGRQDRILLPYCIACMISIDNACFLILLHLYLLFDGNHELCLRPESVKWPLLTSWTQDTGTGWVYCSCTVCRTYASI